jgi:hypothetical protein
MDESSSLLILVRSGGTSSEGTIGDLVVVGSGRRKVVYGRLRGTLSADLPGALGDVFRNGGPDEVERLLTGLGE